MRPHSPALQSAGGTAIHARGQLPGDDELCHGDGGRVPSLCPSFRPRKNQAHGPPLVRGCCVSIDPNAARHHDRQVALRCLPGPSAHPAQGPFEAAPGGCPVFGRRYPEIYAGQDLSRFQHHELCILQGSGGPLPARLGRPVPRNDFHFRRECAGRADGAGV